MKKALIEFMVVSILIFSGIKIKAQYDINKKQELCYRMDKSTIGMASQEVLKISDNIIMTGDLSDAHLVHEYADLVQNTHKHILEKHMPIEEQIAQSSSWKTLYVISWTVGQARLEVERLERRENDRKQREK